MILASSLTILQTFAILSGVPDLCGELHRDDDGEAYVDALGQVFPRYCQPSGPDAPILDAELCCEIDETSDLAVCDFPDVYDRCTTGERYACEYGEATEAGVTCYQPFVDACDMGLCLEYVGPPPVEATESLLCCTSQGCEPLAADVAWTCMEAGGYVTVCADGQTNEDGTVTCFDD
ncbi:hypothetical protein PPSIR1_21339 [Plesiocystis pacifica SIR-1]|uniref:Uncharacterized protein n=1 Tax=Plesiocystis pacifica SIR-1 TaxID=391625 RepID=A6G3K7_9BACT|nr:hypothetical protein [Plesiocystis pacifica]EDM79614.1 hypothetical protein PPSIR1_21339 [Plesiocystis pacifica SIR-1]